MGDNTSIQWTDATWNPVTGCTKVSSGCAHCYAEASSLRLQRQGVAKYRDGFAVRMHPEALDEPRRWSRARMVFTCSMSDFFHEEVSVEYLAMMLDVMRDCARHTFQVLTKRVERAATLMEMGGPLEGDWPSNAWLGTSIETSAYLWRAERLRRCAVPLRFLSCEPLLGPLVPGLDLSGIGWVIVGGESGPNYRFPEADWVRDIRDRCVEQGVPFFFKQWGGRTPKAGGRLLDGREWDDMPQPASCCAEALGE